jgi:hypothetical protein
MVYNSTNINKTNNHRPDLGLNPWPTALQVNMQTITPPMLLLVTSMRFSHWNVPLSIDLVKKRPTMVAFHNFIILAAIYLKNF